MVVICQCYNSLQKVATCRFYSFLFKHVHRDHFIKRYTFEDKKHFYSAARSSYQNNHVYIIEYEVHITIIFKWLSNVVNDDKSMNTILEPYIRLTCDKRIFG
ncbi:unnamed protein product [Leptosia nina]|uniref:Uncharacterized protein n=1 Tax=Leptosia nina TaxID=320188 RepID=A0AAV1JCV4_9NEOP